MPKANAAIIDPLKGFVPLKKERVALKNTTTGSITELAGYYLCLLGGFFTMELIFSKYIKNILTGSRWLLGFIPSVVAGFLVVALYVSCREAIKRQRSWYYIRSFETITAARQAKKRIEQRETGTFGV